MTEKEYLVFEKFWLDNYKRAYFKYKVENDDDAIEELKRNVYRNFKLTEEQKEIFWRRVKNAKETKYSNL